MSDPDFEKNDALVFAHRYVLISRLDAAPIASFAQLSDAERLNLSALLLRPDAELAIYEAGDRILLCMPASHPAGKMELLFAEDQEEIVLFLPEKKLQFTLPRERLPDLLDGTPPSDRADFDLTLKPASHRSSKGSAHLGIKSRMLVAQILFHYFPDPEKSQSWPVRLKLHVLVPDKFPMYPYHQPLLSFALPLLHTEEGWGVLDVLHYRMGIPLQWAVTVINEAKPSGVAPMIRTEVKDLGYMRMAHHSFSRFRTAYRDSQWVIPSNAKGLQILGEARLARIRRSKSTGPLVIRNRSHFAAYVYVDGALIGWVGAGKQMLFKGLPAGYYRIYGRSPTGLRAWGPFDSYVPGPLTFR